jgi:hypothetical protein
VKLENKRLILFGAAGIVLAFGLAALLFPRRDPPDPKFDTAVTRPAYEAGKLESIDGGPLVLYDEGHRNTHTASSGYRPFLDLVRNDGYRVNVSKEPLTRSKLSDVSVLVVVCPRGANDANDDPAFPETETVEIEAWVRAGGSLLLVTDHWPYGPAAASLLSRFGVGSRGGLVEDPDHFEPGRGASHIVFSRDNGLLREHPVLRGREASEEVRSILTFTGQSLTCPPEGTPFLTLSDAAIEYPPTNPRVEKKGGDVRVSMEYGEAVSAGGKAQALALEAGQGRIVILGEAGMLRAHHDGRKNPVGMNAKGHDNRQLALNIMHWLSRAI